MILIIRRDGMALNLSAQHTLFQGAGDLFFAMTGDDLYRIEGLKWEDLDLLGNTTGVKKFHKEWRLMDGGQTQETLRDKDARS